MKKLIILSVAFATLMSCTSGGNSGSVAIKTEADSLANAIGTLMGMQLKEVVGKEPINTNIVAAAMDKVLKADAKDLEADLNSAQSFFGNYMSVVLPARKTAAGQKYIEEASKNSAVKKTESGLLYEIIEAGDEANKPVAADTVVANYKGTLTDGTEFDSSYGRGEPTEFPLDRVIKGWTEGLQLIGKGGKIKLTIPSELAYGNQGKLAGEVLIFEVELVDIKKAQ